MKFRVLGKMTQSVIFGKTFIVYVLNDIGLHFIHKLIFKNATESYVMVGTFLVIENTGQ